MGQVSAKLRRVAGGYAHWCPGCEEMHILPDGWCFNEDLTRPTFRPSFKHSGLRTVYENGKWTGEWVRDPAGNPVSRICHYNLTDGQIHFVSDCTHALVGHTVPLPDLPEGARDSAFAFAASTE